MRKPKELGRVIHYFDKIGVAVVALSGTIKVGDTVKFSRGDSDFEETIGSMQIEHEDVKKGKKGQEVAMKVSQAVKRGTRVLKA